MKILHPLDILIATRTEIENERTQIEKEAGRIQERLSSISSVIAEYDVAISREDNELSPTDAPDTIKLCDLYPFMESALKPITPAKCNKDCGDLSYGRNGDQITIRSASGRHQITSSWDYICDYYRNLPDQTESNLIDLSIEKKEILLSFYSRHPNFDCNIVESGVSKRMVKDTVNVNINTHSDGKIEADESAY
jgi:hypothetical protein